MDEGDEEHLATSYSQVNRLKPLGIDNKHAAIKGMPVLNDNEARMLTQAILAMRGVNQKKHKEQHEEGNLKLQIRTMAYKGTETAWMRCLDLGEKENWIQESALPDGPMQNKQILRHISCPKCAKEKNVERYKVYGKVGFSRIKCMRCQIITTAQEWRCGCNLSWPKCEVHTLKTLMHAYRSCKVTPGRVKVIKGNKKTLKGQDAAYPQRRCQGTQVALSSNEQSLTANRTMLKAGSLLAKRFPEVYARQLR